MSKTTPDDRKGGYTLREDEARLLEPVFQEVLKSKNIRRRSFAVWILEEIQKLKNPTDSLKFIYLSPSSNADAKVGRHQLADHAIEDGCKKLAIDVFQLGDFPGGIDDLPEEDKEVPVDTSNGSERTPVSDRITSDESFSAEPELAETVEVAIKDASDRQITEAVVQYVQELMRRSEILHNNQLVMAGKLEEIQTELKRRRGGKATHKSITPTDEQ